MILQDSMKPHHQPIFTAPSDPLKSDSAVFWKGDVSYVYQAHMVQVVSLGSTSIAFKFVRLADAKVIEEPVHTVNFDESKLVWPHAPSTVMGATEGQWGILFLNREVANKALQAAMDDSGSGTGKWPRASETADDRFLRLAEVVLGLALERSGSSPELKEALGRARAALSAAAAPEVP